MVITDEFIFIHIPKTAGTSITQALHTLHPPSYWKDKSRKYKGHIRLKQLIDELPRGVAGVDERFTFAFVRNPWDRLLSMYSHITQNMRKNTSIRSFNTWVNHDIIDPYSPRDNWQNQAHVPQVAWLSGHGREVDFIGRFENLEEDFNIIKRQLNIDVRLPYAEKNRTKHKPYQEVYTKKSRRRVAELFAKDIERFGYEF